MKRVRSCLLLVVVLERESCSSTRSQMRSHVVPLASESVSDALNLSSSSLRAGVRVRQLDGLVRRREREGDALVLRDGLLLLGVVLLVEVVDVVARLGDRLLLAAGVLFFPRRDLLRLLLAPGPARRERECVSYCLRCPKREACKPSCTRAREEEDERDALDELGLSLLLRCRARRLRLRLAEGCGCGEAGGGRGGGRAVQAVLVGLHEEEEEGEEGGGESARFEARGGCCACPRGR